MNKHLIHIEEIDLRRHKPHPLSREIFGELSEDRLEDLAQDLQDRGLQMPLVLDSYGRIICGSQRQKALLLRGVFIASAIRRNDLDAEPEIEAFLIRDNLHRRQLTSRQMFNAACKLEQIYRIEAEERMRRAAPGVVSEGERGRTAAIIAGDLETSQSTVERLKRVYNSGEADLIDKLDREEISLWGAAQEVSKRRRLRASAGKSNKLEAVPYSQLKKSVAQFKAQLSKKPIDEYGSYKDEARGQLEGLAEWLGQFVGL